MTVGELKSYNAVFSSELIPTRRVLLIPPKTHYPSEEIAHEKTRIYAFQQLTGAKVVLSPCSSPNVPQVEEARAYLRLHNNNLDQAVQAFLKDEQFLSESHPRPTPSSYMPTVVPAKSEAQQRTSFSFCDNCGVRRVQSPLDIPIESLAPLAFDSDASAAKGSPVTEASAPPPDKTVERVCTVRCDMGSWSSLLPAGLYATIPSPNL